VSKQAVVQSKLESPETLTIHPGANSRPQIGQPSFKPGAVELFFDCNLLLPLVFGSPSTSFSFVLTTTHCCRLKATVGTVRLDFWGFHQVCIRKCLGSEMTRFFFPGSEIVMDLDPSVKELQSETMDPVSAPFVRTCFLRFFFGSTLIFEGGFLAGGALVEATWRVFASPEHAKT